MSVKHGLLALLCEQQRHGYDLKQELEARTGGSWQINIGQIYTTLERLERDGLVSRLAADPDGRVPYAITDAGRDEAQEWFAEPLGSDTPTRNELTLKVALALPNDRVDLTGILQRQRFATMRTLQQFNKIKRTTDPDEIAQLLTLELGILNAEAVIRWLDHCETHLPRLRHAACHPRRTRPTEEIR